MKNHPPLRVVTVAFNPGPDLASMAASLENATSSPYELVIVDNGSDPTIVDDVARRFGAQVIRTGENLGYGRAANLGLAHATSEWGVVVNPDVVYKAKNPVRWKPAEGEIKRGQSEKTIVDPSGC